MSGSMFAWSVFQRLVRAPLLAACALGFGIVPAAAQQGENVPKSPAYAPPKEGTREESNWVKLCTKEDKADSKQVCLVRYEGLDPKTGQVVIAAAVRSVEGEPKQQLLVNVPLSYSLVMETGVQIKIDDGKPVQLQYSVCLPTSCQVQMDVPKDMLANMRKGGKMFVAAMNSQGKTMAFPISLSGFSKTSEGPPVDNVAYQMAREQMVEAARKRQRELAGEAGAAQQRP